MSSLDSKSRYPQDIVAIFHASFHPTQGNVIDWFLKASDDLSLEHLEFSALPSGLHLVEQDTVYFTKDGHHGVCIFRRRKTTEHGHRGFRLSSVGILLAKSLRPRPWRHASALKDLVTSIYSKLENSGILQPSESDWEPARVFFNERSVRNADLGGAGNWNGWIREFEQLETDSRDRNPTLHLPHLLRILGPSSITLYKHVLGRQRILIYTLPPVEAACILCQVAADMCYEDQVDPSEADEPPHGRLRGKSREGIAVLGMVTLTDFDRMQAEGKTGRGWIACTTDAIFLEKPSCYDLIIDLTTSTPNKATRPTFYASRPIHPQPIAPARGPTHRLSVIRFAWSDVKLWNELDRLLQLDSDGSGSHHHDCCSPSPGTPPDAKSKLITTWTDAWRVYEDVCLVCAGLWMGSWRGNSTSSYSTAHGSWGSVRLDGDDDLSITGFVRNVGLGIEGGPAGVGASTPLVPVAGTITKGMRRASAMSWSSGKATVTATATSSGIGASSISKGRRQASSASAVSSSLAPPDDEEEEEDDRNDNEQERRDGQLLTTLALLQTFHAHTCFQLSTLESFLPPPSSLSPIRTSGIKPKLVLLTPKDIISFDLGPLSNLDARYLEWLADEYAQGMTVVVKRGWRDLVAMIFGYG